MRQNSLCANDYRINMIIKNQIKGLLNLYISLVDGNADISYEVMSKHSLQELYKNKKAGYKEINKIIKSLDKSRSSRHKQTFPNFNKNKSEEKLQNNDNKSKLSVQQREQNKGKAKNKAQQKSKSPPSNSNKNDTQKNDKKTNEKSPSPQKKTTAAKKKK